VVAAMTTPGGLGGLVPRRAAELADQVLPWAEVLGGAGETLAAAMCAVPGDGPDAELHRVGLFADGLAAALADADPARVDAARRVAGIAAWAEADRSLLRLADLSAAVGVAPRTLQRLFAEYVGVSPTWVLRRYRLLEAAERVRDGRQVRWAQVATELGYSDQAHLVRDFRAALGVTPQAYAARQRDPQG
jgi:AraC-like DNA-binding protein